MIGALLLAVAAPMTAIDAERALAADAQALGQWTAFRKWAADDAVMFAPQQVNARAWLQDRANPIKSVTWWPTASYVSCDGNLAVNTGGWQRADGSAGYFSTVWRRHADGRWKWVFEYGDTLKRMPSKASPKIVHAACDSKRTDKLQREDALRAKVSQNSGDYHHEELPGIEFSKDYSLEFMYLDSPRYFSVSYWNGRKLISAIVNRNLSKRK